MTDLFSWDEWLALDLGEPDWLIQGLLERGGGGLLHGASQSFKSFFLLRLCLDLAAGLPVLDIWPVSRRYRTVFLQAEGSPRAWRERMVNMQALYQPGLPFWSKHVASVKLDSPVGRGMVREILATTLPDLVVIDPMANFFQGDETGENMQRWLDEVNLWREACGCAVLLAGHDRQAIKGFVKGVLQTVDAGMDEARGSTRLPAWADFVGSMKKVGEVSTLTVQKTRDGIGNQQFKFRVRDDRLVLAEAGDVVGGAVLARLAGGECWLGEVVQGVVKEVGTSPMGVRRAVGKLVGEGKVVERREGGKVKLRRTK